MKYHSLISRSQQTGTFLGIMVFFIFLAKRRLWEGDGFCAQPLHWHDSPKPLENLHASFSLFLLSFTHSFLTSSLIRIFKPISFSVLSLFHLQLRSSPFPLTPHQSQTWRQASRRFLVIGIKYLGYHTSCIVAVYLLASAALEREKK